MASGSLWVLFTLLASSAQTLRNAMQRDLIGALGAVGAAQVRFLFGLPFAVLFLAGMLVATGLATPQLTLRQSRLDGVRGGLAGDRHRDDAGRDAHAQFCRRRRLYQDRAGAGRALRPRRVQRDADPLV